MGIETLAMLAIGAVVGGTVSKATGGSFVKGAALGAATGGIGVGVDRMTGGHLTGGTPQGRALKRMQDAQGEGVIKASVDNQTAIDEASSARARQLLASGGTGKLLMASGGLSGNSGGSARRKLLGG